MTNLFLPLVAKMDPTDYVGFTFFVGCMAMMAASAFFFLSFETDSKVYRKKSGIYKKYELVTSHIGRRSFATNFYGIIPTSFLIYMTGHSTEAMFLNYIGKSNKDIALEMTKYF